MSRIRPFRSLVLSLVAAIGVLPAAAQDVYSWESYDKRVDSAKSVVKLGDDLFGDSLSLQNGGLSFSVTDVSLPGNNALPVAITRNWALINRRTQPAAQFMGDWDLAAPRISASAADLWLVAGASTQRCSDTRGPSVPSGLVGIFEISSFWQGLRLETPSGGGELLVTAAGVAKPTDGRTWVWTTGDGKTHVSCLPSIRNGSGQGFLAVTPDGTRYTFDWMARRSLPTERRKSSDGGGAPRIYVMPLHEYSLYATRVEDRHGNWVAYTYTNAATDLPRLTRIHASDGRELTLAYAGPERISSVSDGSRTWTYGYAPNDAGKLVLRSVTRPDGRSWQINFQSLSHTEVVPQNDGDDHSCLSLASPENLFAEHTGTITHPSGAVGSFRVGLREHGRSNVTLSCSNVTTFPVNAAPGTGNSPLDDVNQFVVSSYSWSLLRKEISGPGVPPSVWTYDYVSDITTHLYPGTTPDFPVCMGAQCFQPACTSDACAGTARTFVVRPDGHWERYVFGNSWQYNEGKLLRIERGSNGGAVLETVEQGFDLARVNRNYLARYGRSTRINVDGFDSEFHRPQWSNRILREGTSYEWSVAQCGAQRCFDAFARPTQIRRFSNAGSGGAVQSKTDATTFFDHTGKWVIGQLASSRTDGIESARADYDSATANLLRVYRFGALAQTLGYAADGTVSTVKDGRNFTTTLTNWYRGVPRTIGFPDGTSVSATVTPQGWLTSATDQNGATTTYTHDAMGRLATVTHPSGDAVSWTPSIFSLSTAASAAYGLPAGHWQWRRTEGARTSVTYLDALFRPVVEETFDAGNPEGTRSVHVSRYDAAGRAVYRSHPQRSIIDVSLSPPGVTTGYDALGRVTGTNDAGRATTVQYLSGGRRQTTNARGNATTESFLMYDAPTYDRPRAIDLPTGVSIAIARDVFGNPTAMTRSGGGVSATRSYIYDGLYRLCKAIDPETGATVYDYDTNGNLSWSATGQASTSAVCDRTAVATTQRSVRSYDALNRLTLIDHPAPAVDTSYAYTPTGLLRRAEAGPNVTTYEYNRRGMPIRENFNYPGAGDYPHVWEYDTLGNLAAELTVGGVRLDYAPNALGQASRSGSFATNATYDAGGRLAGFTYGNGMTRTFTYNTWGEPTRIRDAGGPGVDLGYGYDANGNIDSITDHTGGTLGRSGFSYDGLDRLLTVNNPGGFGAASYTYDSLDNLRTATLAGTTLTYQYSPGSNRLASITNSAGGTAFSLSYDANGNVVSTNARQHRFDTANRLTEVVGVARYEYDAHGRRTMSFRPNGTGKNDVYTQDGVLRYTSDSAIGGGRVHIYLSGLPVAERMAKWDGSGINLRYLHTDALRSPVAGTGASREVLMSPRAYQPYGKTNQTLFDRSGYTYHMEDRYSDLVYMQQRYYDPAIGRFLSVDPVGPLDDPLQHFGRYHYAYNNPYKYVDPDGRIAFLIPVAVIAWRAYSAYDTVTTAADNISTVTDSTASTTDRVVAGVELLGSAVGGKAGRTVVGGAARAVSRSDKVVDAAKDTVSATRRQALNAAKDANGVPRSAQPDAVIKPGTPAGDAAGLDSRNVRQYEYTNSQGDKVSIREDRAATYSDGGSQQPHFNAGQSGQKLDQHHYIDDKKR